MTCNKINSNRRKYFDNSKHKKSDQKIWAFNCIRRFFARNKLWRVHGFTWAFWMWQDDSIEMHCRLD